MDADVEARLRRLEDLAEIHQLFVDYGAHLDAGDVEAYAGLFAADGEVRLGPLGRARGRTEIVALMTRALDGLVGSSFHIVSSPQVTLAGDTATARVMWTVVQRDAAGRPQVAMIGHHNDELVREAEGWRFRLRRGSIDIPSAYGG